MKLAKNKMGTRWEDTIPYLRHRPIISMYCMEWWIYCMQYMYPSTTVSAPVKDVSVRHQ